MSAPDLDVVPDRPETNRLYRVAPDQVIVIGHDTPDGPEHNDYDERILLPINEEQVLSFMAVGVQVPLRARREPGRIVITDGRRRTIESREANRRLLAMGEQPISFFVHFSSARLSAEMQLTLSNELNERRTEDPPDVKRRKAIRMLEKNIDIRTVARVFGKTTKTIYDWRAMSEASPDLQAAADLGMIPSSAVAELARAPEPQAALEQLLEEPKPTRLRAAAIAKDARRGAAAGSSSKLPRGAVQRVLACATMFSDDFIRGVKFAKGDLPAKAIIEILEKAKGS